MTVFAQNVEFSDQLDEMADLAARLQSLALECAEQLSLLDVNHAGLPIPERQVAHLKRLHEYREHVGTDNLLTNVLRAIVPQNRKTGGFLPGNMGGGKPKLWEDPDELEIAVDAYFEEFNGSDAERMPTWAGICYHLGFADKEGFQEYENYGERYSRIVKRARLRFEHDRNVRLLTQNNVAGSIFDLKNNHDWQDRQQVESRQAVTVQIVRFGGDEPEKLEAVDVDCAQIEN